MLQGTGSVIGKKAPDFILNNQDGSTVQLSQIWGNGPVILVFYPGDFTPVCTRQLCNYKDNIQEFEKYGVKILGISSNPVEKHKEFAERYDFPFQLLSDPGQAVAKQFGCQSKWMLGKITRAVFIISKNGILLYRYLEPTTLTRRKADELVKILQDMKTNGIL